jgi:glycogen(starch) synthase
VIDVSTAHQAENPTLPGDWTPEVVHLHSPWLWQVARNIATRSRARLVYTVHSLAVGEVAAGEVVTHGSIEREAIEGSDLVIALCRQEQRLIASIHPSVRHRVRVVGNGVAKGRSPSRQPRGRAKAATPVRILFVGRFATRKGLQDLFDAIPLVLEEDVAANFVLVGSDSTLRGARGAAVARSYLPASLKQYGHSIDFTGWLEGRDLERRYRAADILVVPSRYEPFGMVVLEGMQHGLAIAAADTGGPAEILDHGRTGLLFRPADPHSLAEALRTLTNDWELRSQLGLRAREVVQEWSWNRAVAELQRLYVESA